MRSLLFRRQPPPTIAPTLSSAPRLFAGLLWTLLIATPTVAQAPAIETPTRDPPTIDAAQLYAEGCSSCHGPAGAGLPEGHYLLSSFDPPPADLTVPLFNSREPAADWFLVVKHGGARIGLSNQMPAYNEVYTDEQIHAVVAHLKTLVDTRRYPPGDLNFPRPIRTIKPFPEDEALILGRFGEGPGEGFRSTLYYARRFAARFQGEVKASRLTGVHGEASEDELELGLKWAFFDDLDRSLLLGAGLEAEIPLQDGGATVAIPYFGLAKGIGDYALHGNVRLHLPTDDTGAGDVEVSLAGHRVSTWPRGISPGLELVFRSKTFDDPTGSGEQRWSTIPQALIGLSKRGHVALGLGAEIPLAGYDFDYRGHFFLLWDFADGPFWKGW